MSEIEENEISSNWDDCSLTFDEMNLKEDLLRGVYAYGFEKPSPIQQKAVKPIIMGRDLIAQAQSGKNNDFTTCTAIFVVFGIALTCISSRGNIK